jgi:hypothetical protein
MIYCCQHAVVTVDRRDQGKRGRILIIKKWQLCSNLRLSWRSISGSMTSSRYIQPEIEFLGLAKMAPNASQSAHCCASLNELHFLSSLSLYMLHSDSLCQRLHRPSISNTNRSRGQRESAFESDILHGKVLTLQRFDLLALQGRSTIQSCPFFPH